MIDLLKFLFEPDGSLKLEFRKHAPIEDSLDEIFETNAIPDWEKVEAAIMASPTMTISPDITIDDLRQGMSPEKEGRLRARMALMNRAPEETAGAGIPLQNEKGEVVPISGLQIHGNVPDPPLQEYTVILHHKDYDVDPCTRHVRGVGPADAIQVAIGEELDTYTSGWSNADLILERRKFHCDACILGHYTNLAP